MATSAPKKKISSYFNEISNPAGGLSSLFSGASAPSNKVSSMLLANAKPSPLASMMPNKKAPMAPIPSGPMSMLPLGPVAPTKPAPAATPAPVFTGSSVSRGTAPAPVAPTPAAPVAEASQIPPQWLNADGSIKTPEQIAADIGTTLKNSQGAGDIGTLAGNEFGGAEKTAEQLRAEAMQINNTRNDIAVGANDPYKVASKSGIAYTPAELRAIESAYAGIYDPAITTALAKVEQKQIEDEAARKAAESLASDERNNAFELTKMEKQFGYDKALKQIPTPGQAGSGSGYGGSGGYVQGADPVIDGWVERILRTGEDLNKALPGVANTGLRSQVMLGLNSRRFDSAATAGTLNDVNTLNTLLQNEDLSNISGFFGQATGGLFGNAKTAKTLFDQISGTLQLAKAGQIKGQGAVSDYERSVLKQAAIAADRGQSDGDFRDALIKIRGAMMTSSGLEAPVKIMDPSTGQSDIQNLSSMEIAEFIKDGAIIEYVEIQ